MKENSQAHIQNHLCLNCAEILRICCFFVNCRQEYQGESGKTGTMQRHRAFTKSASPWSQPQKLVPRSKCACLSGPTMVDCCCLQKQKKRKAFFICPFSIRSYCHSSPFLLSSWHFIHTVVNFFHFHCLLNMETGFHSPTMDNLSLKMAVPGGKMKNLDETSEIKNLLWGDRPSSLALVIIILLT